MSESVIDYEQYCTLNGIAPSDQTYARGGKIAEGRLRDMVTRGVALIEEGYNGVIILTNTASYRAEEIQTIFNRSDFLTR
ncbi:MAG: hypothetical protein ACK4MV_16185 [Beijerinckiaceae bacterium]